MKILGTMLILIATLLAAPAHAASDSPTDQQIRAQWARQDGLDAARHSTAQRAGTCRLFGTTDTGHEDPSGLDKWVDVRTRVLAKQCIGVNGHRWVRPVSVTYSYNVEHSYQSCGYWDEFEGVRFNLYLSDGSGRNYHPNEVRLYCEEDTTSEHTQSLAGAPNFRYCWGFPKWKANYTVVIDNWNDVSGVLRGTLWDPQLPGPFPSEC